MPATASSIPSPPSFRPAKDGWSVEAVVFLLLTPRLFIRATAQKPVVGFMEGWSVGDAVYFTFVTGLTIGYGDIVPRQALARALAIGIGLSGLFLTGLIAGIAVYAMRIALTDDDAG
jgi:hypothetical protein